MDTLVLMPDCAGGMLLQRMITVHLQLLDLDSPVINCDDVMTGICKVHSKDFNRAILSTGTDTVPDLAETIDLMRDLDHYKVLGLRFSDRQPVYSPSDLIPFYRSLDENCFVIACRRQNLFDMALSGDPGRIDTQTFLQRLEQYKSYLAWCERHFHVAAYFVYENHVTNMEQFLNAQAWPCTTRASTVSWQQKFGMSFDVYNRARYQSRRDTLTSKVTVGIKSIDRMIESMQSLGIVSGQLPIKNQTLQEKCAHIDVDLYVRVYNEWIANNPGLAISVTAADIKGQQQIQNTYWNACVDSVGSVIRQ